MIITKYHAVEMAHQSGGVDIVGRPFKCILLSHKAIENMVNVAYNNGRIDALNQAKKAVTVENLHDKIVGTYNGVEDFPCQSGLNYGQMWVITAAQKAIESLKNES